MPTLPVSLPRGDADSSQQLGVPSFSPRPYDSNSFFAQLPRAARINRAGHAPLCCLSPSLRVRASVSLTSAQSIFKPCALRGAPVAGTILPAQSYTSSMGHPVHSQLGVATVWRKAQFKPTRGDLPSSSAPDDSDLAIPAAAQLSRVTTFQMDQQRNIRAAAMPVSVACKPLPPVQSRNGGADVLAQRRANTDATPDVWECTKGDGDHGCALQLHVHLPSAQASSQLLPAGSTPPAVQVPSEYDPKQCNIASLAPKQTTSGSLISGRSVHCDRAPRRPPHWVGRGFRDGWTKGQTLAVSAPCTWSSQPDNEQIEPPIQVTRQPFMWAGGASSSSGCLSGLEASTQGLQTALGVTTEQGSMLAGSSPSTAPSRDGLHDGHDTIDHESGIDSLCAAWHSTGTAPTWTSLHALSKSDGAARSFTGPASLPSSCTCVLAAAQGSCTMP
jgi:hypothetical protein